MPSELAALRRYGATGAARGKRFHSRTPDGSFITIRSSRRPLRTCYWGSTISGLLQNSIDGSCSTDLGMQLLTVAATPAANERLWDDHNTERAGRNICTWILHFKGVRMQDRTSQHPHLNTNSEAEVRRSASYHPLAAYPFLHSHHPIWAGPSRLTLAPKFEGLWAC